jgi:hypothetical protein
MYQDKAGRKRRSSRDGGRRELLGMPPFDELTDLDIQRAAAGIL